MSKTEASRDDIATESGQGEVAENNEASEDRPKEIGGRKGPDPTRYGDWEKGGRCIDF
jgi:hypothetical protein